MMKDQTDNGKDSDAAEKVKVTYSKWLPVRFVLVFLVVFLVLQRGYLQVREDTGNKINQVLNAQPAATIINLVTPSEGAQATDATVVGRKASVEIMKGCEGFEVLFVLLAAFTAFPMPWRRKALGMLLGTALVYTLNLIRIMSLYYIVSYRPQLFDMAHITIWQTVMILIVGIYFLCLLPNSQASPRKEV